MSDTDDSLREFLYFLTTRQEIIAENIANVNTPGKISKEIKFTKKDDPVKHRVCNLSTTNPKHIAGSKPKLGYKTLVDTSGDIKPNGNNIDLTHEAKKGSENRIKFDTALKAYKSGSELLKIAISKSR